MKREPAPTLEQLAEVIRHVDLTRLNNRMVGKQLLDFEHCLIEVLGALMDDHRLFLDIMARLAKDCIDTTTRSDFLSAFSDYTNEKGSHMKKHATFSPIGRYFYSLLVRLNDLEEKQINEKRTITVSHARSLVAMIVGQLDLMARDSQFQNSKIDKLWEHWISEPLATNQY